MDTTTTQEEKGGSLKMLQAMVGIGVICALLIVLSYEGTLPRVQRLRAAALEKAIFKVIPGTVRTQAFVYEAGKGLNLARCRNWICGICRIRRGGNAARDSYTC
ncbi:MAG: hypothetical protein R2795_05070 [Saprospiraceae bacterium]